MQRIEKGVLLGLVVAVFLAWTGVATAFDWGSKEGETEKIAVKLAREVARGGYGLVTTEELKGWLDAGKDMLIVDTMPLADSYLKNHIPGAVQHEFPVEEMPSLDEAQKTAYEAILGAGKDRTLVIYCGFTKCGRSHNGALWAKKLGYTDVYRYPGGIKAWKETGLPVEAGE